MYGASQGPVLREGKVYPVQGLVYFHVKGRKGRACGGDWVSEPVPHSQFLGASSHLWTCFPQTLRGLTLVEEFDKVHGRDHQGSHLGVNVGPQHPLRLGAQLQGWGQGGEGSSWHSRGLRAPGLRTSPPATRSLGGPSPNSAPDPTPHPAPPLFPAGPAHFSRALGPLSPFLATESKPKDSFLENRY
jgi:hypothetical protein